MKPFNLVMFFLALALLQSCAAPYRYINPGNLAFDDGADTLFDGAVRIAWQYNVLSEARNHYYANLETSRYISLIGLSIFNGTTDTLRIPGDVKIYMETYLLQPLLRDETFAELCQTSSRSNNTVEVESLSELAIVLPVELIIVALRASADFDLRKELEAYYLYPCAVPPGHLVKGLIALPVQQCRAIYFVEDMLP